MSTRTLAQDIDHVALRPLWICRVDAWPWPCADARLQLRHDYRDNRVALYIYLSMMMHEAMADLHKLDECGAPGPRALFERFLGWVS